MVRIGVATLPATLPPGVKDELVALNPPELALAVAVAVAVADALVPAPRVEGVALPFPLPRGTKLGTKLFAEAARAAREVLAVDPPGVGGAGAGAGVDGREWVGVAFAEDVVVAVPVDEARALRCWME